MILFYICIWSTIHFAFKICEKIFFSTKFSIFRSSKLSLIVLRSCAILYSAKRTIYAYNTNVIITNIRFRLTNYPYMQRNTGKYPRKNSTTQLRLIYYGIHFAFGVQYANSLYHFFEYLLPMRRLNVCYSFASIIRWKAAMILDEKLFIF